MKDIRLPETCLVLLMGPSSAGKSTFAKKYFLETEVISSDYCRALVADDENDLSATAQAFDVLNYIASKRLKLGKLTVIDALNLKREDRSKLIKLAKENYALAAVIVLEASMRKLLDRHEGRTDRNFGKNVLSYQYEDYKQSLRTIEKEGFSYVYFVDPEEELKITRQKLYNNKKDDHGPFDIIGDIHGCFDELFELLRQLSYSIERTPEGHFNVSHAESRRVIFLGDLVDKGYNSPDVLRLVMDMVKAGKAYCISGNHEEKLNKFLAGKNVSINHGLDKTVQQLESTSKEFREELKGFLYHLNSHYVLANGDLVVAHGGLIEEMHGRASPSVRAFCLYGESTGEIDEFGLPVRYNWAKDYKGKAMVVYGHTPIPETEWLNNTLNIDTGCVFGGKLTALRYPEKVIVSVPAREVYYEPIRPFHPIKEKLSAQQEFDDLLDIDIIHGKKLIETQFNCRVTVREENAVAALEVMSRFASNPKWLIYLPPTMSPPETSSLPHYLEHPSEAFNYYLKNGVTQLICEEKHMGSRAIAIVCKDPEVAVKRFGLLKPALGTIYTRTGRNFFEEEQSEGDFLIVLHQALTESGFWEKFHTDWVCLDGELMPWSAKAKDLLTKQYAAVGAAGTNGLAHAIDALNKARSRGIATDPLIQRFEDRHTRLNDYIASYRNYCRKTSGIEGLVYAPFHILATENKTYHSKQHTWHLDTIKQFCEYNPKHLMVTSTIAVDLMDPSSVQAAIDWWKELSSKGGEGMVVKPLDFVPKTPQGKTIQPAIKCRGSEYLRIIYGPEYDFVENLRTLKERNVKMKRDLALREFALGLESLSRFVNKEPLRRIHECVFGILALESESVDPRL